MPEKNQPARSCRVMPLDEVVAHGMQVAMWMRGMLLRRLVLHHIRVDLIDEAAVRQRQAERAATSSRTYTVDGGPMTFTLNTST